ncbi:uncharacterized protein BDZ99DRAFT_518238 [Mytilinidion resinicola]|uniref:Transcription initiation factor TFIID subunit 8 n=1 Tax=Mytilinidion resinicola TaxID=574789 RepID=A0A6A6YTY5_9PEZI|nr:uncharacterized protein BDZ99DRAFT_518238 [Mytilinidion resinicola]KAF2812392.1 hypothetical protein BDZ99DRAFT_518238 [Mytilinidion resinicola]
MNSKRPRPADDADDDALPAGKRPRIIHHKLKHKQAAYVDPMIAPQDEVFFQSQLLRAITLQLGAAGFDSATPSAMESIRAQAEEFMLHFLRTVKQSMNASRRNDAIPQDFIHALTRQGITPADLVAHLDQPFPAAIVQPPIPAPEPQEPAPPDLEGMLGPELSGATEKQARKWIPKHLPNFPSKHTYKSTPVFSERIKDPGKIRERAIQEGVLAEKALRKLMAAEKLGAQKKGAKRRQGTQRQRSDELWLEAMKVLQEDEDNAARNTLNEEFDDFSGVRETQFESQKSTREEMFEGMQVNYDKKFWRKAAART